MLTLDNLKVTRMARKLTRENIASVTGIEKGRLRLLEVRAAEPWFDEAVMLSRALCTEGLMPLISVTGNLSELDVGETLETDLSSWQQGFRSPLSLACRMAIRYGLTDPIQLSVTAIDRQIWDVLKANERNVEAPGWCPWCQADIIGGGEHKPTCLPNNLWSPHEREAGEAIPLIIPAAKIKRSRGHGVKAHGLKALRESVGLRQLDVAERVGINGNYYARLERGDVPLTPENADKLINFYQVEREVLYAEPEGASA